MTIFDLPAVRALIDTALAEDIGRGDLTSQLTVPVDRRATAMIVAKQAGVLAGGPLIDRVFGELGGGAVAIAHHVDDGSTFTPGTTLATLDGPATDLLAGERVTLNLLQHLSGIATLTRRYVEALRGTSARVIDTRKTTPGLRGLEKYAVRMGGGRNHRLGLDDGILIKDNHITAAGGVTATLRAARDGAPHTAKIQIECATLAQVEEALAAGADAILLDNMSVEQLRVAVGHIARRAVVEASGGITLENIRAVGETGVDVVSVGALTHSAPAIDMSMKIRLA